MATGGRISLLIDSPLRTLAHAMREWEPETKRQIGKATKSAALPIWRESTRAQAFTRMQARLAESATVSVTAQNVFLRVGSKGTLSSGTPLKVLAKAIEFGADPETVIHVTSPKGKSYKRKLGRRFRLPRSRGYVAHPAAADGAIRRIASLWVQTAIRTLHEQVERASRG